jgi:hypothetical protein
MKDRRYREDEVRKIFGLATEKTAEPPAASTTQGLTLAEMQSIGLEVGLDPDAVARAAATFEARAPQHLRKSWGMPIEVGRTVSLPRAMTDHEWEQLVAELRRTFRAKGDISAHGGLKEWTNGNLHASVEPTETGYRLRLGTLKGDAAGFNALGVTGIAAAAVVSAGRLATGAISLSNFADLMIVPILLGVAGAAALASNWIRLPRWANKRQLQMNHIAARVRAIMGISTDDETPRSRLP